MEISTSMNAIEVLAKQAFVFFEEAYSNTDSLCSLIKNYSRYRVMSDVSIMVGGDRRKEIEKPLIRYRDKIDEYLFEAYKSSLSIISSNIANYQNELRHYSMEELHVILCKVFLRKLLSDFLLDLFYALKENCRQYMRKIYPIEAAFVLDNHDYADGYDNELYGRSVKMIVQAMYSLGIDVPVENVPIIYGNVTHIVEQVMASVNVNVLNSTVYGSIITAVHIKLPEDVLIQEEMSGIAMEVKMNASGSKASGDIMLTAPPLSSGKVELVAENAEASNILTKITAMDGEPSPHSKKWGKIIGVIVTIVAVLAGLATIATFLGFIP